MTRLSRSLLLTVAGLGLTACSQTSTPTPPVPTVTRAAPAPYPVERLVGSWGVASYRAEKDRARTEAQARSHCKLPYTIAKGPTDGVMMHVADNKQPFELTLKGGANGKTYLGFDGPAGDVEDREVNFTSDDLFTARYVSPEIDARYGTYIYVRCKTR